MAMIEYKDAEDRRPCSITCKIKSNMWVTMNELRFRYFGQRVIQDPNAHFFHAPTERFGKLIPCVSQCTENVRSNDASGLKLHISNSFQGCSAIEGGLELLKYMCNERTLNFDARNGQVLEGLCSSEIIYKFLCR